MHNQNSKNYIWNTVGSLSNALVSILITIILNRCISTEAAGLFSLGFTNAMMMQHIGSFDSRSVQCADVKDVFSFPDFLTFRSITNFMMLVITFGFTQLLNYTPDKFWATILLCIYCIFTNFSDIFQGLAQKNDRLDISGKSMFIRAAVSIAIFGATAVLTQNIYVCLCSMIVVQFFVIIFFDLPLTKVFSKMQLSFHPEKLKKIFLMSAPLCACMFLQMLIYNMPKYAIDAYANLESQAVYSILFLPASVMTLFANILFRPVLTGAARLWENRNYLSLLKLLQNQIALILGTLAFAVAAGYVLGIPILSILYGIDLSSYRSTLVIILCGSGFAGISSLMYFISSAVHRQMHMMVGYIFSSIFAGIISFPLVQRHFLKGAAWSYLLCSACLCLILWGIIIYTIKREQKRISLPENIDK